MSKSSPCFNRPVNPFCLKQDVSISYSGYEIETKVSHRDTSAYEAIAKLIHEGITTIVKGTYGEARGLIALLSRIDLIDVSDKYEILIGFNKYICSHDMAPDEVDPVRLVLPPMLFSYNACSEYKHLYHKDESAYIHIHSGGIDSSNVQLNAIFSTDTYFLSSYCMGGFSSSTNNAFKESDFSDFLMNITESIFSYNPLDTYAEHALEMTHFVHPDDKHYLYTCDTCGRQIWNGLAHDCDEESFHCEACEYEMNEDEVYWFNDVCYCYECFHEVAFNCYACGDKCSNDECNSVYNSQGNIEFDVCDSCRDRYDHCDECGELYTGGVYNYDETWLCRSCAKDKVFLCPHCGEDHLIELSQIVDLFNEDSEGYEETRICDSCIENDFSTCDVCGRQCNNITDGLCYDCNKEKEHE